MTDSITIQLAAIHTSAGSVKIIGFDNVKLTLDTSTGIQTVSDNASASKSNDALYDLSGRRLNTLQPQKGIYIKGGRKVQM